jgi:hypothetical protein
MSDKDTVFARILELVVTADEGDDTLQVTAINFARGRQRFAASDTISVPYSGGAAAANCEVELGGVFPAPSVIRLTSTFQA